MSDFIFYHFVCGFISVCYDYITRDETKIDALDLYIYSAIFLGGYISFYFAVRSFIQFRWWDK